MRKALRGIGHTVDMLLIAAVLVGAGVLLLWFVQPDALIDGVASIQARLQ